MDSREEIQNFLRVDARLDLKILALQYVLGKWHFVESSRLCQLGLKFDELWFCVSGLTGTEAGRLMLLQNSLVLTSLISHTRNSCESIAKDACLALVNISADEPGARTLLLTPDSKDVAQVRH
jgi:hypothetical protein